MSKEGKYTETELLKLAGIMAITVSDVLGSKVSQLPAMLGKMQIALTEYNNAIVHNSNLP